MDKHIIAYFKEVDPVLYSVIDKIEPLEKREKVSNLFAALCDSIIGQQLSVKAGDTIYQRFTLLFPNGNVSPEVVQQLPTETIKACGLSYAKTAYVKDIAEKVLEGTVELEKFDAMSDQAIIDELTLIKGVGPWTAEMFLLFALGREDVFSAGDLGLKNAIARLYALDNPSKQAMLDLSARWSPHRSWASRILWKSLAL